MTLSRLGLPALLLAAILAAWALLPAGGLAQAEQALRAAWAELQAWRTAAPGAYLLGFFLVFALLSAFALPGCAPLCLLAGESFGPLAGTLLVGAASTVGACASFGVCRTVARDWARARFGQRLRALDRLVARRPQWRLFWLRLVPLLPYPVLNPLLGLSRMPLRVFFWPSLAGLTLGSLPYVLAGCALEPWLQGAGPAHLGWLLAALASLGLLAALWQRQARRPAR